MMGEIPIVTIDGPGGAGKGTVARHLAGARGWHFLDSGAIYRVLGLAVLRQGLDPRADHEAVVALARALPVSFGEQGEVWLDGEEVSAEIRTEKAGSRASVVAAIPAVREALLERQRAFGRAPGLVADGRDMGTVVFPGAPVKIFLTASAAERARRRHKQLKEQGLHANVDDLSKEIAERDRRDMERSVSPLKPATGATQVDTTELALDEVVEKVMSIVRAKLGD
ncbi:(d)CMP kinase [Alkalilimnicola sp. S0819]|uniref:(d)CMP kinase n=1 Tax=Alkalilimnicola sp. S0819 TaxID=2613922 RepID=UPI0012628D36|nr:(d)CMP kinase [Alkalilimnicola sp. S0819]KAB7623659.1 (d)CMP kinase [Alkalilimnicola sp. S0819]MPQ16783.1 (d)CMP kinase [Alkalilimnicola sp. S0819]